MQDARSEHTVPSENVRRNALRQVLAATVPPLLSFVLLSLAWPTLRPFSWFLFYPTVFISSWLGGFGSGIGATLLSTALVWWGFLPFEGVPRIEDPKYVATAALFVGTGTLFSVFHGRLRRVNRGFADALAASQRANERLEKVVRERLLFAALIENSSDFIGIADAAGKPTYLNPAGRSMVGIPAEYPIASTEIPEYYPPDLRPFAADVILKSMLEKGSWKGETCFRHWQTEESIPVSDSHFMIRDPATGKVVGMGTITRDISDVQRAREAAEANRRLQHVNQEMTRLYEAARRATRARDEVLAVVAHDLRNPLATILMHAARLQHDGGAAPPAGRGPAEAIERAAKRMNRLIEDLLDASRMEAGQLPVKCEPIQVPQVLGEVMDTQTSLADRAAVTLELAMNDELPVVSGDRGRLSQILENLIGNAIKFTPSGGHIVVGARPSDHDVLFWVSDTGAGIGPEELPHVFDRFWQASKFEHRGSGLGLPIAKGLVEALHGHIWVESQPGRGSSFYFTLPTVDREAGLSPA